MMRKLFILFVCMGCTLALISQEVENKGIIFEQGSLKEALTKAKQNPEKPKLVFVDCFTDWCGPCKYMANNVFTLQHVGEFFNSTFVNIKIDMEKGEGIEVGRKYDVRAYPTFLILDANGEEINRIIGGNKSNEFIAEVKEAMNPNYGPNAKMKAYYANKNFPNAFAYIEALQELEMSKKITDFITDIFSTLSNEERYSPKMWPFTSQLLLDPASPIFDTIVAQKGIADKFAGKENVDAAISSGVKAYASRYVRGQLDNSHKNDVISKVAYLNLLASNNAVNNYIVDVVKYYSQNNLEAILKLLNVDVLMRLANRERSEIDQFILSVKGITLDKGYDYHKKKQSYYLNQAQQSGSVAETYFK